MAFPFPTTLQGTQHWWYFCILVLSGWNRRQVFHHFFVCGSSQHFGRCPKKLHTRIYIVSQCWHKSHFGLDNCGLPVYCSYSEPGLYLSVCQMSVKHPSPQRWQSEALDCVEYSLRSKFTSDWEVLIQGDIRVYRDSIHFWLGSTDSREYSCI